MKLLDYIETYFNRKEYEKNFKKSSINSAVVELMSSTLNPNAERTKHPFHYRRVEEYKKQISYWKKGKHVTINFGDSLTDLARSQVGRIHNGSFSICGSWPHHIEMMAKDLSEFINDKVVVKNVSVGCLGGNPLLVYENYDAIVLDSLKCLDTIRRLFPQARIVVYGLPSVFNIHVVRNTYQFDTALLNWCSNDINARFLSLKNIFGQGLAKIFSSVKYSCDGFYFNPDGAARFTSYLESNFQPEY